MPSNIQFYNPYSYIINKKKLNKRILLLHATPLYGDKQVQKGSFGSCLYNSLNYIRCRYKQHSHQYPAQRRLEKIFSDTQHSLTDLILIQEMLANLFELWIQKDGFAKDKAISTEEWVAFFTKKAAGIIDRFNFSRLTKTKNDYLYKEACRQLHAFIDALQSENLPENLLFNQIRVCLGNYFERQDILVLQKVLTEDLKLNVNTLIINFLKKRNLTLETDFDETQSLSSQGLDSYIHAIYLEQVARFNNLHFFSKEILEDINTLLDTIETNGGLVFNASGQVARNQKQIFVKDILDFSIYDLEFEEDATEYFTHAMVLVGGEIDSQSREFVYVIDPNKEYSEQSKTPIYRLPYIKFKNILHSLEDFHGKLSPLNRYFFLYGDHGLNRTRDPVPSKETKDIGIKRSRLEIDSFNIKKLKSSALLQP